MQSNEIIFQSNPTLLTDKLIINLPVLSVDKVISNDQNEGTDLIIKIDETNEKKWKEYRLTFEMKIISFKNSIG